MLELNIRAAALQTKPKNHIYSIDILKNHKYMWRKRRLWADVDLPKPCQPDRSVCATTDPLQQPTGNTQHRGVLLMLKGPSLQCALDVRQAHVLVTSRHSFKIKIQSVPMNFTITFIHTGKKLCECVCVQGFTISSVLSKTGWMCSVCGNVYQKWRKKVYLCVMQRRVLIVTPPPQLRLHSP